jgi:prepilin-type N-terminal cleavage/methylation domain-containing protein
MTRRRDAGFTLIEMIAVIAIIGIMVGVAAGRLDYLVPKYRLRGAAREVGSALKQAKGRAAAVGKDVYLEVDLSAGDYWILVPFPKETPAGPPPAFPGAPPPEPVFEYEPAFQQTLPDGVQFVDVVLGPDHRIATGRARVRCTPFGMSSHVIVNLKNDERRELAVKLNGFTGTLTFYDAYTEADKLLEDTDP